MESEYESELEDEVFIDPNSVDQVIVVNENDQADLDEDMDDSTPGNDNQDAPTGAQQDTQDDSVLSFTGHTDSVYTVAIHPSNEIAATGGGDDKAFLWSLKDPNQKIELSGHKDTVSNVKFSYDGKYLATSSFDSTIKIWESQNGQLVSTLEGPQEGIESIVWHPKGNVILAGAGDGSLWMWMSTGNYMNMFQGHKGAISVASFSIDGKQAISASDDGTVRIWDPKTAVATAVLQGYGFHEGGGITSLATHPTNAHVILTGAQDGSSVLSNISTGKPMGMTKNHSESVETVAFCNSMPLHATGGMDKLIMIYDSNTFQLRGQFAHEDSVVKIQWHPTQPLLYSCSVDKTVRLWDARTVTPIKTWKGHHDAVLDFSLSNDGNFLVSTSDDQAALLFKL